MALAACRECGTQVSDLAATCPSCGVPDPVETETWVTVTRKGKFTGAALTYYLTIDDATDTIAGGENVRLRLKPGEHHIELETTGAGSKVRRDTFTIAAGETVSYEIGFSAWSGATLTRTS